MSQINILLAEKQPLIAAGLKYFIDAQPDLCLLAEAESRESLLESLQEHNPQLLIIAYDDLPDFQLSDFALIRKQSPLLNIMALSSDKNKNNILQVLNAGVIGFLTKECSHSEVLNAIRATARGEKFFCAKVFDTLMGQYQPEPAEAEIPTLNEREIQVIRHITQGLSTKEIADKLNLSTHTINAYRKSLLRKLDVRTPAEITLKAIQLGLIKV